MEQWKGSLMVLFLHLCISEVFCTSNQSYPEAPLQESQRTELPSSEVMSVLARPSLEEVQQAVQEASEQAESRGAEEVLKELLERVVEAALGQADGGDEVNAGEMPKNDNQSTEWEAMAERRDDNVEEETGNVSKSVDVGKENEEGKDIVGPVEEAGADLETRGTEEERVDFILESPIEVVPEIVGESIAASEETEQASEFQDAGEEQIQVEVLEREVIIEGNTQKSEILPDDCEVAANAQSNLEIQTVFNSSHLLTEREREITSPSTDNYEIEATHTVEGEQQEEENVVMVAEKKPEDDQGHLVIQGGAAEVVDAENTAIEGAEGGERFGHSITEEESVPPVDEAVGEQLTGDQTLLESLPENKEEDEDVLVISALKPEDGGEASVQQILETQSPTASLFLGGTAVDNIIDEKSHDYNEIVTPTEDPVLQEPVDNLVNGGLDEHPQAIAEELGEAGELVEDTASSRETGELGQKAWKIAALSAAAFLLLETIVITIYICKRYRKSSTTGEQRACEEGCVEPEATTGGDYSGDTLLASDEGTQHITVLDQSEVMLTLAQNKEEHKEDEHGVVLSDLPACPAEESDLTGLGPDSPQALRMSAV